MRFLQDHAWVSYNTSKSAVLQMGRSMACELGPKRIRVNTLSPGHIYTEYVTLCFSYSPLPDHRSSGRACGYIPMGRPPRTQECGRRLAARAWLRAYGRARFTVLGSSKDAESR